MGRRGGGGGLKFLNPLGCYGPVIFKIKQNLIQEIGQSCDNKGHLFKHDVKLSIKSTKKWFIVSELRD